MAYSPQEEETGALSSEVPSPFGAPATATEILQRTQDTEVSFKQLGQWELVLRRFRKHKLAMVGIVVLVLLTLMAILAPVISPETYLNWNYLVSNVQPRWTFPGAHDWKYIMGTDVQGHTLLMWITYGARVSLAVGLFSSLVATGIGVILGGTSGYFGGWVDTVIMRVTDVFFTLPTLPLIITLSYYISGGSWVLIVLIFGIFGWPGACRQVRAYYLSFRQQEFTEAARAQGVADSRIIFRHILPNVMGPVIVLATLSVASFIVSEAAIDFLGVGIKPPNVSWGLSLANAEDYFGAGNWWWAFFPGFFILITVLAINFLGDGLRDALDVRARGE